MSKALVFYNNIQKAVKDLSNTDIKDLVGDSLENNRVASVNQLIRLLETSNVRGHKLLARNLREVYTFIRPCLKHNRLVNNNRTDAYDMSEFTREFGFLYSVYRKSFVRDLGRIIK